MLKRSYSISPKIIIVGLIAITCLVAVSYASALKMGFYTDDYTYLESVGRLAAPQYISVVMNPQAPFMTYRPLLRVLFLFEYIIFRFDPTFYHLVQILLHLGNCLLLFGIVWRLSKRWRLALIATLLYASLPVYSWAVFWISVHDPSATLFYLAALWFWTVYLETAHRRDYLFAMICLVLALLGKETSATLPIAFFLIDRWFVRKEANFAMLVKRYVWVAIVLVTYLAVEYIVQVNGIFVTEGKYSLGPQIVANSIYYLTALVMPWGWAIPQELVGLLVLALVVITLLKRSKELVFLELLVLLNILPVLAIPWTTQGRYVYFGALGSAILLALIIETIPRTWFKSWHRFLGAGIIAGVVLVSGLGLATESDIFSEIARQKRVPFRDIMRQYPTLPPGTLLYFLEPSGSIPDIQGMFYQQYGANVLVKGTFEDGMSYAGGKLWQTEAHLRNYAASSVYYFNADNRAVQVPVDKIDATHSSIDLPVQTSVPIELAGYELTGSTLRRGDAFVLLLYWRGTGKIDQDYDVFVHLVDPDNKIVAGDDSKPRSGKELTSTWRVNQFTADGHVISVPVDAPLADNYRLEIGLYYLPTMERVEFLGSDGHVIGDSVVIAPCAVTE